ncbi:RNaseH domain-containing protein [Streptomyces sp. OfavH-34-F]|uniref:RNaseH domain-containing protein n=1 Tax=Streptomyces sp. OfavH-34-F TaxID=2917760 RepID=UPI001EF17DC1|nr:RNaseH domain-containing protein [Streptomyces sp. OfavH-34-F]MCG7524104.1 RNaseH domain-containing protein [Streptomyces sp. OfavH-34-F]
MLITLAYRVPRQDMDSLLGSITAYPLTSDFAKAWENLPGWGNQRQPRYSALATGLVAATGQPVRLFGEHDLAEEEHSAGSRMLLVTTDAALDDRLRVSVRAWERHVRDGKGALILPGLLPAPERARSFVDFVKFRPGRVPVMPGWMFRTAEWQVMRRLAEAPLRIDGRTPVRLSMDTDGSLLAWEPGDLLVKGAGSAFSMHRVTARLTTRAGVEDPVLCFDAHLSRISPQGDWAKNVWIDRNEVGAPILRLPLRRHLDKQTGEWRSHLDPAITKIIEACQLSALEIPDELPLVPGAIRPQLSSTRFHALGNGPGPRFMLRLHEHIVSALPLLVPLSYEVDKRIRLAPRTTKYPVDGLPADAVGPSGFQKVTLACLHATPEGRDRMLAEVEELTGHRIKRRPGERPVRINARMDVVIRCCPELLSHDTVNRAALLDSLNLPSGDHHLVAALLETEFHPDAPRPEIDAKPHLRRLLGHLGIPTQFLSTEPTVLPPKSTPAGAETKKHSARAALRDLLRAAGVLDRRLLDSVIAGGRPHGLSRDTLLVGIHARRQHTGGYHKPLVLTMVALYVDPDDLANCQVLIHSDRQHAWVRGAEGVADFHSGPIGTTRFGRTEEKAPLTRDAVEAALGELVALVPDGTPVVIFVDTAATRTIWPGLQNVRLNAGPLPGDTVRAGGADIAVVRLNTKISEIGRPVTRREKANMPSDPAKPAAPDRKVYRLPGSDGRYWLFAGRSVTLKAKGGATGASYTRWTVPDGLTSQLSVPWHSYTSKEIVVVSAGSWAPEQLAALTASLCEQAVSWDDRTQMPVPLHLATVIDDDHPEYRASWSEEN